MGKATHLTNAAVGAELRLGGIGSHVLGGQPLMAPRVPSNWFPINFPAASAATPQNSDCTTLLGNLAKLVALLTVQQSVVLANCYRTMQAGVVAGGKFTVNSIQSATTTSWFDQSITISEPVAVDVVNKNPTLTYDLALRLALKAAAQIDSQLLALYAGFTTVAAVGSQGSTPTAANFATQIAALANTGEPIFAALNSQIALTSSSPQSASVMQAILALALPGSQSIQNGQVPLFQTSTAARAIRLLASDNVKMTGTTTQTSHNVLWLPSGYAFASADQGSSTGSGGGLAPSGTVIMAASNYRDPESGLGQLALQLVVGNTGSGAQTIYVNCLGTGIVINVANGAVILS